LIAVVNSLLITEGYTIVKILFPDTNFFIQCREGSQLNWSKLFPDEQNIVLVIPKAVADEIDRQKQDGNTRRAKKARKANSFFREIILSEEGRVKIKDKKPTVEATFSPPDLESCSLPNFLDLGRNDDQIIAEILRYKATKPGQEPSLLTHDTNPLRTAKLCGLSFVVIPDEWLLEAEPDPSVLM
jgi:predicted ribonuclease YlaK